ncbi:alpha/beta hydrolase [Armatimonas sp.]|uniref:alpha/beta hydrolase n=1 Tax=Armatimonas sp. TaxID=1872638 RepID=UPI0037523722
MNTWALFLFNLAALALLAPAYAQTKSQTLSLYPPGHPTLQGQNEKEILTPPDPKPGQYYNIKNVHNPIIEVFLPPKEKATGTLIVVAPGGGHRELGWPNEGIQIAQWLNSHGVAAAVLKYRLAQTPGYKYTVEGEALQDTQRAFRLVRANAKEWGVDTKRVGILGFSAGGALAALVHMRNDGGKPDATDPIERESCRPDFVGLVYAGWAPMSFAIPPGAGPAFLVSAGIDDAFHARQTVEYYNLLFTAKVPAELHIYGHGGHGGAISERKGIPFGTWHVRLQEWMADLGYLKANPQFFLPPSPRPAGGQCRLLVPRDKFPLPAA